MQKLTDDIDAIVNVIGTKTATASRFVILNKTGADIASIISALIQKMRMQDGGMTW